MPQRHQNTKRTRQKESILTALYYIKQVGNYEAKILWRSWLFRVFAILILALLLLFNLFGVIGIVGNGQWPGSYVPGNVAYINFFMFTVAQVVIAAFLSADFLGRERKMDTTEVFYTRPMSNLQYVLGKTWGTLQLFFGLSLVIFLLSAIVSLVATGADLVLTPMLVYLFVYSLPSLVFILGFSFIIMIMVRNQAVTFVIVLGFGATVLFYLKGIHNGVWDFMGFYLPMHYSGFSGFSDFASLLLQRTGYLLLGLAGVLLTAFFLPRLPGHRHKPWGILLIAVTMAMGTAGIFYKILHQNQLSIRFRKEMVQQERALSSVATAVIDSCELQVEHNGSMLSIRADLHIRITGKTDSLILALNPGFQLSEVFLNQEKIVFSGNKSLLYIPLGEEREPGDTLNCQINYRGAPSNATIYPYVDEENRALLNRTDPLVAGKQYAFVQDDYLLLTRETGWYPVVAWKYYRQQPAFTAFSLSFKSQYDLEPLSQGARSISEDGFNFNNRQPLNALTLLAGPYQMDSITVDSVDYMMATHRKYGKMSSYFTQVSDTLPALIRDIKSQYESRLGLKYPFSYFRLVEVPVHFFSYLQPWSMATDHTQPEFVLIPENGGGAWFGDAHRIKNDFEKTAERQGQDLQPREIEARTFVTLAGTALLYPVWQFQRSGQEITRTTSEWNRIQVFPLYYDYVYQISESNYPAFKVMLGDAVRSSGRKRSNVIVMGGSGNQYSALLNLNQKSLTQWLESERYNDTIADILQLQGINFFSLVSAKTEGENFLQSLSKGFDDFKFKCTTPSQWFALLDDKSGLLNTYREIKETGDLPAFRFGNMQSAEVTQEQQTKYYVSFEVSNAGHIQGVLDTYTTFLNLEENRGGSFSQWMYQSVNRADDGESRLFLVPAGKKVKVGMIFEQMPRHIKVETGVARNIPPLYNYYPQDFKNNASSSSQTGIQVLGDAAGKEEDDHVFIVDNEDTGFIIKSKDEIKTLKDWWVRRQSEETKAYPGVNYWNPPVAWTAGFGDNFYGDLRRSAVQKVSANGDDKASWKCLLPKEGNYEVQVFIPSNLHRSWRFRKVKGGFNYLIHHAGGVDQVESPVVNEANGWVTLGRYFFNEGEAVVELSDRTNYPYVIADAVKWIKQ